MHRYFGEILKGKRAVITGANRGLGLLMARRFLECGAKVAICCAPNEEYSDAVKQLQALDAQYDVMGFRPDLNDTSELDRMVQTIEETWGGIDILVNNAGIYPACIFDEYTPELFEKVFALNVQGVFTATKSIVKVMEKQAKGVILNTSSMAGTAGAMRNIGYTASKFAVEGLTLGMARELGPKGIRVNAIAPAGIKAVDFDGQEKNDDRLLAEADKINEVMRFAKVFAPLGDHSCHPDEIINAFIFLASDAAGFISGQTIEISGACIWSAASPVSFLAY